jgi:hypothetical protein
MATEYFARVEAGIVIDVRRVTPDFLAANPDLYPGEWVQVASMDQYPAVGWSWDAESGFTSPPSIGGVDE